LYNVFMSSEAPGATFDKVTGRIALGGALLAALSGIDYLLDTRFDIDLIDGDPIFGARGKALPPLPANSIEEYVRLFPNPGYTMNVFLPWLQEHLSRWHTWDLKSWSVMVGTVSGLSATGLTVGALLLRAKSPAHVREILTLIGAGAGATFSVAELAEIQSILTASTALQWGGATIAGTAGTLRIANQVRKSTLGGSN
jgi:hypothetical protein